MSEKNVLVLSGLDPSGGAGIAADIESIAYFGVSALPIVTMLSVQNTESIQSIQEVDNRFIKEQFYHLKQGMHFSCIKVGALSSIAQIETLSTLLASCKNTPIVLDPIINSTSQYVLLTKEAVDKLKLMLLPLVDVLTPNLAELQALAPDLDEHSAIQALPCDWVLLTTTDVSHAQIKHRLYYQGELAKCFYYRKLDGNYHGSGCTLASSISALLALDMDVELACKRALDYTYQTLLEAKKVGKIQYHPNRILQNNQ